MSSSDEMEVKKTSEAQESSDDDYNTWLASEKKRKRAEYNRRYREKKKNVQQTKKITRKSQAEYMKAYRERKKLMQRADTEATTSPSVSSKILKVINDDPESDQYEAEIRYQQFLPKMPSPQISINSTDKPWEIIYDKKEVQTDSEDSDVPLKRRKIIQSSSSSEINFEELEESGDQYTITTEHKSDSDDISMRDIVPETEEFTNMSPAEKAAEAARRYRMMKKILKPTKPPAQTAAERSKAYRERQKSLQSAAKIITNHTIITFDQKGEVIKNQLSPKSPAKTPAEKSRDYRERKKSLIMAAVEGVTEKQQEQSPSETNEDDIESDNSGGKRRMRYVLTLDDRVAAIRQFDTEPMYDKIARKFNCNVEQIMRAVANRKAILEFHEATIILSKQGNDPSELRRRKLNLLGYCLFEYTQRAKYQQKLSSNKHVSEELILRRAIEFRDLMAIEGFTPSESWIKQFMAAYEVNCSNSQINMTPKPRTSLDLKNIMSHCVRHSAMASNLKPIIPKLVKRDIEKILKQSKTLKTKIQETFKIDNVPILDRRKIMENIQKQGTKASHSQPKILQTIDQVLNYTKTLASISTEYQGTKNQPTQIPETFKIDIEQLLDHTKILESISGQKQGTIELDPEVDECVAIKTELKDDINDSPQKLIDNSPHSSLKIEKLHHSPLHISDYPSVEAEVPETAPAPSSGHYSVASDEPPLPRCVENFKDALRLLKPLEDFALMRENYRVIGLLSQLEQIFEAGKKSEEMASSVE